MIVSYRIREDGHGKYAVCRRCTWASRHYRFERNAHTAARAHAKECPRRHGLEGA